MRLKSKHYLYLWTFWFIVAALGTMASTSFDDSRGRNYEWWDTGFHFLASAWGWAVLTPALLFVFNRFRLKKSIKSIGLNVLFSLFIPQVYRILVVLLDSIFRTISLVEISLEEVVSTIGNMAIPTSWWTMTVVYWLMLAVIYSIDHFRKFQKNERLNAELKSDLAMAQLNNLKAQIQPHFLFNTLQSIATLMHKDVDDADRAIGRLSVLLRKSIEGISTQKIKLEEELNFIREYLELHQIRFGNRIKFEMQFSSADLVLKVPNLILQPIIENAIKYGVEKIGDGAYIEVSISRESDQLKLLVINNFKRADDSSAFGIGLRNTADRLKHLYSENASLTTNSVESEFFTTIIIPVEEG